MHAQQLPHAGHAPPLPMMPHPAMPGPASSSAASLLGLSGALGGPGGPHPLSILSSKPPELQHRDEKPNSGESGQIFRDFFLFFFYSGNFLFCLRFNFLAMKKIPGEISRMLTMRKSMVGFKSSSSHKKKNLYLISGLMEAHICVMRN